MAKAKRKKPSNPRPAPPRGMYLTVHVGAGGYNPEDELHLDARIESFADITRVGHRVARAVREYLKRVPMTSHVRSWSLTVYPEWHETAAPKPKQPDGAQRAADLEALEE